MARCTVEKRGGQWAVITPSSGTFLVSRNGSVTTEDGSPATESADLALIVLSLTNNNQGNLAGRVHGWWSTRGR